MTKSRVKKLSHAERLRQSRQDKKTAELEAKAKLEYEFEMSFCIQTVRDQLNQFVDEYNWGDDYVPECIVIPIYEYQDLILALKLSLINTPTYWQVEASSNFYCVETDHVLSVPFDIELPEMTHAELMSGSTLKINRGHGIKTRWKGLGRELEDYVKAQNVDKKYKFVNNLVCMRVQATFRSVYAYMDFQGLLSLRDMDGLDEFLADYQLRENGELKPKPKLVTVESDA